MADYVPFEDVDPFQSSSEVVNAGVDDFHLRISTNALEFTKANQEKTILISNVGRSKLPFASLIKVGGAFDVVHELPALLLPGINYPVTITYNQDVPGEMTGGIYIDVGNSYGNKFVLLTGNVS